MDKIHDVRRQARRQPDPTTLLNDHLGVHNVGLSGYTGD
jgi:hypothetical protein